MYLYLDTTSKITYGILNQDFEWISYKQVDSNKGSALVHGLIYEENKKHQIELKDVKCVFYCAGPGSYTGMRVSEGFIQILNWQNIDFFSFHHFEVPGLLEVKKGRWVSKAFKGEYFVCEWLNDNQEIKLIKESSFTFKGDIYSFDEDIATDEPYNTQNLVFKRSKDFFSKVLSLKLKRKLYYYRPINEEFKKGL